MDFDSVKAYCAAKKAVTAEHPFDEHSLVYKVMGKMFALMPTRLGEGETLRITLKCDPVLLEILRQNYPGSVTTAPYMSHKHWNLVAVDGSIPDDEIRDMIDHSYEQVVKGLTKKQREEMNND
jgi:predicted DNA-binding protein (MmcQ/YjbR family)